jgi:hypothetical protein
MSRVVIASFWLCVATMSVAMPDASFAEAPKPDTPETPAAVEVNACLEITLTPAGSGPRAAPKSDSHSCDPGNGLSRRRYPSGRGSPIRAADALQAHATH